MTCALHRQVWGVGRPHAAESIQEVEGLGLALAHPGLWSGSRSSTTLPAAWLPQFCHTVLAVAQAAAPGGYGHLALMASSCHSRILCITWHAQFHCIAMNLACIKQFYNSVSTHPHAAAGGDMGFESLIDSFPRPPHPLFSYAVCSAWLLVCALLCF